MWKTAKIVILLVLGAFLAGLLPTLADILDDTVIFSVENGLALHPKFAAALSSVWRAAKDYTWHFTILYACILGVIIFMEGQNPDRTILWLLTLVFVPVVGVILYVIIGPDMHNLRNRRLFKPSRSAGADLSPFTTDRRFLIGKLLHSSCGADLTVHNKITVLINGDETFPALLRGIRGAEDFIDMQYFIIKDDDIGREVRSALVDAAGRGVKVRVLYDAVGSWGLKPSFFKPLEEVGAECRSFMPVAFPLFRRQMNYRNHRKITVIDGRFAFTGGLNLGDEYRGLGPLGFWRDTHVMVEGEAVAELHSVLLHDWCVRTGDDPDKVCDEEIRGPRDFDELPVLPVQVVSSGVDNVWHSISQGYCAMISRAKERVWITSPYLVPGPNIMAALISSALAGVDARVLMPARKDHFLVYWGSRGNIEPLLRAGVRVYMYKKGFIHTKSLVADGDIASVGTCNMDVRSLEINFETQLFIYSADMALKFAEQFEDDLGDAEEIKLESWEKRPLWQKALESFGRLYSAQI